MRRFWIPEHGIKNKCNIRTARKQQCLRWRNTTYFEWRYGLTWVEIWRRRILRNRPFVIRLQYCIWQIQWMCRGYSTHGSRVKLRKPSIYGVYTVLHGFLRGKFVEKKRGNAYFTSISHILNLMLVAGLEPARCCHRGILSPLRLPIPPHQRTL